MTISTARPLTNEEQNLINQQLNNWFSIKSSTLFFTNLPIIYNICNPLKSTIFITGLFTIIIITFIIIAKTKLTLNIILLIIGFIFLLGCINYIYKSMTNSYIIKALPYLPPNATSLEYYKYWMNKI